jgi:hypothetical protein
VSNHIKKIRLKPDNLQISDQSEIGAASEQKGTKVYTSKAIMGSQKPMNI